ncbi:MAG: aromatic ring-hydroxylating dioxygenase subunit alpha [Burkholderiaceae bacterium]
MSDLSSRSVLAKTESQLPVTGYFDESILLNEKNSIFLDGGGYIGHELMVPEAGNYYTLPSEGDGRVLIRNQNGVELLSNVCRHRQSIMLRGRGTTENIVCPLHRWTYDLSGQLLGAPQFAEQPCATLDTTTLQNWRGLLFDSPRNIAADLASVGLEDAFDFSGYRLDHVEMHDCHYNWKTFLEVYLEDYHVGPFHPGLGQFVTCDDLHWTFGERFSVQTVGLHKGLREPGTAVYEKWHAQVLASGNGKLPKYGAIWLTYYPNMMLEWYPNVLVVSNLYPVSAQRTMNIVEFYYPEEFVLFERDFIEAERAAYMETAVEDDEIALRMDAGRKALMQRGLNQTGPYQSPTEDGMRHFHEFLRQHVNY